MASIALLVLLLALWQHVCAQPDPCTKDDLCNVVSPEVCNNTKCLELDIDFIHQIINKGTTIDKWNILRPPFTGGCPFKVLYEPVNDTIVANAVNATFSTYVGDGCSQEVSLSRIFSGDIDPSGGTLRVLTAVVGGQIFEDCFLYIECGIGLVYRRCVVDGSAESCAAIYTVEVIGADNTTVAGLYNYLDQLGVNMSQTVAICDA